jgi:cell division protein FtsA
LGGRPPRKLPRQILGEILQPRMEEVLALIHQEIQQRQLQHVIGSGVVLTGGGAMLEGATDVAEAVFKMPARLGKPVKISGLSDIVNHPMYATGVGLVTYGAQQQRSIGTKRFRPHDKNIFYRVMAQMKKWFKEVV